MPDARCLLGQGCVIIFLSNFLALLIKVDGAGSGRRDVLAALIVVVNVALVGSVILTSWFATQKTVGDSQAGDNPFTVVKSMITAERLEANSVHTRKNRGLTEVSSGGAQPGPVPVGELEASSGTRPVISHSPARLKGSTGIGEEPTFLRLARLGSSLREWVRRDSKL